MKYWRGYITAALFLALTLALQGFADKYSRLVDMVYPYVSRMIQTILADWSAGFDFCMWQVLIVVLAVLVIASIVLMVLLRWNFVQWLGWILACASILFCLHTGIYGLNTKSGPLADDIRLNVTEFTTSELVEATTYYRDKANEYCAQLPRDEDRKLQLPTFGEMAENAGSGFKTLTLDRSFSVFGGSTQPVKELGMSDLFTSKGIDGFTVPLTAEAMVNPQIPGICIPFTMCREMARRMCIAREQDSNMAAFLACQANEDPLFQYSGYLMAYRYCYNALASESTSTAKTAAEKLQTGLDPRVQQDLADCGEYFQQIEKKSSGDKDNRTQINGEICTLLVSWYIQDIYIPSHQNDVEKFDPFDPAKVGLAESTGG